MLSQAVWINWGLAGGRDIALAYMGLRPSGGQGMGSSSDDPAWLQSSSPPNGGGLRVAAPKAAGQDSPPAVPVLAEGAESPMASPRGGAAVRSQAPRVCTLPPC